VFIKTGDNLYLKHNGLKRYLDKEKLQRELSKEKSTLFGNSEDLKRRYSYRYFKYQAKI